MEINMAETRLSQQTPLKTYRRAILVGASSGIGAELAQKLADEGYLLALLVGSPSGRATPIRATDRVPDLADAL